MLRRTALPSLTLWRGLPQSRRSRHSAAAETPFTSAPHVPPPPREVAVPFTAVHLLPPAFQTLLQSSPKDDKKPKKAADDNENNDGEGGGGGDGGGGDSFWRQNQWYIFGAVCVLVVVVPLAWSLINHNRTKDKETSWQSVRETLLGSNLVDRFVVVNDQFVEVYLASNPFAVSHWFSVPSTAEFEERLQEAYEAKAVAPSHWHTVKYDTQLQPQTVLGILPTLAYAAVILLIIDLVIRNRRGGMFGGSGGGGSNPWTMSQMKSAQVEKNIKIGFKDVAGMGEAKEEIVEFVSFLKDPERYTRLGAKVPNGAILLGPPGTGKTLLAKAVAGESKVPFLSVCGSDFVEMFVGVGPGRMRSLFKQARKHKRCIIYIDEIDAIARPRGSGVMSGGNDERENTLNALLVEMDGFEKEQGRVVVIASTNVEPDQLDSALLRPGRFDRRINVPKPEIKERVEIFKLHLSPLALMTRAEMAAEEDERNAKFVAAGQDDMAAPGVDPTDEELKAAMPRGITTKNDLHVIHRLAERLARLTPGFVGADIANICNEGALIAAREHSKAVRLRHLEDAVDRVIGGIEKRSRVLSDFEKKVVAYHEAGHAIVGWFLKYADPLMKISVIPRGSAALGYAQYLPKETSISNSAHLADRLCVLLGGRVSELLNFGHLSTGAADDLQKVTQLAYSQVSQLGMFPGGSHLSFPLPGQQGAQTTKPYSDEMAEVFDVEVKALIDAAFLRTKDLLERKTAAVKQVADHLLKYEVITRDEFAKIVGPRPFEDSPGTHPDDDAFYSSLQTPLPTAPQPVEPSPA